jgi:hypothetical protein
MDGVYAAEKDNDSVAHVHFAKVSVVFFANQAFSCVSHGFNVQVTPFN